MNTNYSFNFVQEFSRYYVVGYILYDQKKDMI